MKILALHVCQLKSTEFPLCAFQRSKTDRLVKDKECVLYRGRIIDIVKSSSMLINDGRNDFCSSTVFGHVFNKFDL